MIYNTSAKLLDILIDIVGNDENHILVILMDLLSLIIEYYENKTVPKLK